ncbi:hypothetical protein CFOL_v3_13618 [Cephalotus follicularis]|uniref:Uncharacterized protein n=1 Tax=Cephalotus follicularis TaxID=3775 RepID=A0A1Q3BQ34_CEPFO|nr:hypothetical protein CFOL_v3_13618 [Cephalotus follicularis]
MTEWTDFGMLVQACMRTERSMEDQRRRQDGRKRSSQGFTQGESSSTGQRIRGPSQPSGRSLGGGIQGFSGSGGPGAYRKTAHTDSVGGQYTVEASAEPSEHCTGLPSLRDMWTSSSRRV